MQTFIYLVYSFCEMEQKIAELESKMKRIRADILTKNIIMVVSVLQSMKRRQPNGKLYCLPCYMQAVGSLP